MALHILKMCVGTDRVEDLERWQAKRLKAMVAAGQEPKLCHWTRHAPRRADEIVDGGSLYWVMKGFVRVRQRIVAIERHTAKAKDAKRCALVLDPQLVRTDLQPRRPHQGWRYLEPEDAPADLDQLAASGDELPPNLVAELQELGLL